MMEEFTLSVDYRDRHEKCKKLILFDPPMWFDTKDHLKMSTGGVLMLHRLMLSNTV